MQTLQQHKNTRPDDFARSIDNKDVAAPSVDSAASTADRVSLSPQAARLNNISDFFVQADIDKSKVNLISQQLYQEGLVSAPELEKLTGQKNQPSPIAESVNFLNGFIRQEAIMGDSAGAAELVKAVKVIENVDQATTETLRQAESKSYEYVHEYKQLLEETSAPQSLVESFDKVLNVFHAINSVRNSEQQTGVLASFASVQQVYEQNQNNNS